MDVLSHGLWGGIAFGRKNKISWWKAFLFGVLPDISAFGPFFISAFLGLTPWPDRSPEPPSIMEVPQYIYRVYNVSHSLVIFTLVFCIVWLIFKRPIIEMLAWPLHIFVDLPTHTNEFFPTPIFWPISEFQVNGIPWSNPYIFIPNVILLIVAYLWWYRKSHKKHSEI